METKEAEIIVGKGNPSMQDEYLDFINYVFGFNGQEKDFYKILPKLYKKEYDPSGSSYFLWENGKIKAAVGAFSHDLEIAGERLSCRGIGNVAVHPYSRGKGYMKKTLGMAMDDMVKDGIDISFLGGRRARYNYFSFERAGVALRFKLSSDAIRHHFGKNRTSRYTYSYVKPEDTRLLDEIAALSDSRPFRPIRPRARLYDTLISWGSRVLAVTEDDRFVGYAVVRDTDVNEVNLTDATELLDVIVGLYDTMKRSEISVILPPFCPEYAEKLFPIAESYEVISPKMCSVLCYERVVRAFFKLKATYETLPDGELTLLIHGRAGDERLLISVRDGIPSVSPTDLPCDRELSHIDAINLLFSSCDPRRRELPLFARDWFPLPIYMYSADIV